MLFRGRNGGVPLQPVCLKRGKVQENREGRQLRRVKEEKAARPVQGEAQQAYMRALVEELRKRAREYCDIGVPKGAQLFDLR